MKRRPSREFEIFSLSAIDLFAAAMSAFALLTIVLMPDYQKELIERTPENNISDLTSAAAESVERTTEQRKALEEQREAAAALLSDIQSEEERMLAEFRAAQEELRRKQAEAERVVELPEPVEDKPAPTPGPALVTFRFLGMKTDADDIVVALDMNGCMRGHESSISDVMSRIITSLQDHHRLSVVGFQQTDSGPRLRRWPSGGGLEQVDEQARQEAIGFSNGLTRQFGGSASMRYTFEQLLNGPAQSIFLVSDGLPNPAANGGLRPMSLASEITRMNGGSKEINTVVVGNYFDFQGTVEFMETLAERNGGQFMALASYEPGACS